MSDDNTGYRNTGNWNTGYRNTGDRNIGNFNSGILNVGNYNTGNWNTGYRNTGNLNTGDLNTGSFNLGNFNTGFFCTETPCATFFDKPTSLSFNAARALIPTIQLPIGVEFVPYEKMTDTEKAEFPKYATIGGYLRQHRRPIREVFPIAWAKLSIPEQVKWMTLPNFDRDKFLAITGVDVRKPPVKTARVRMPNGTIAELPVVE
jgi:hypothetical protein